MGDGIARLIGSLLGAAAGVGLGLGVVLAFQQHVIIGVLVAVVVVVGTILLYIAARSSSGSSSEGVRAGLIGMNSGINGALVSWVLPFPFAIVIGLLTLPSAWVTVSRLKGYKGVLGWGIWVLPMSWPIVGLGFTFGVVSLLGFLVTFGQAAFLRLLGVKFDGKTGTLFVKGGWIANINTYDTAFNMGNFAFVDMKATDDHIDHEAGHSLNLAAFGWAFHLIGFVDEVILNNGVNAYSEKLAESNVPGTARPKIPMWKA